MESPAVGARLEHDEHTDRRVRPPGGHPAGRPRQPLRLGGLALPPAAGLALLLRRPPRHARARPLAPRARRGGPLDAVVPRQLLRPRHRPRDRLRPGAGHRPHAVRRRALGPAADRRGGPGPGGAGPRVGGPARLRQGHPVGVADHRPRRRDRHPRDRRSRHVRAARPAPAEPGGPPPHRPPGGAGRGPAGVLDDLGPVVVRSSPTTSTSPSASTPPSAFFQDWASRHRHRGPYRDVVTRSLLVLRLLTDGLRGGIVAAPTTSLPEDVGGSRNWDYRYCWLRDASLTLEALLDGRLPRRDPALAGLARPGRRRRPRRPADHVRGGRRSRAARTDPGPPPGWRGPRRSGSATAPSSSARATCSAR